ncbi:exopolysaccharide production repressor protein [Sinorhizobium alkalisoli]|uniref:Exopolysaccharide production repressor exox n=1 Tax=Sinorhizobium alkalisoli TaxID=1752398 RepID=A0A1E3V9P1_9HYPH|nr:exopolysaccharide production repressor protein [Sinorhizobium alkalisoli]MCG5478982.1 exopolysaccharide production repressor protein [Sinorhizobium alkalisoli]ODR89556.1 exopolysaccharide production repressor exox [Sinorhizobium alkalisoli]
MFAPRFFVSMLGALVAFAIATYYLTGSFASTAVQTLICAVLIQVGYFFGVLFLIWKEARERRKLSPTIQAAATEAATEEKQSAKFSLRRVGRPRHFNS